MDETEFALTTMMNKLIWKKNWKCTRDGAGEITGPGRWGLGAVAELP